MFYWIGIVFCLSQSAMFSGLTIGLFGLSRLRLEVESAAYDQSAKKILRFRKDSNFLLATLLWGNVSVNVLLTMLTESVLAGLGAFVFSTFGITIFGEVFPQAYFSRNASRVGAFLLPLVRIYQVALFPFAKPTALILDKWLGKEGIDYFEEKEIAILIQQHASSISSDISPLEGAGAVNFLALDDMKVSVVANPVTEQSILRLPFNKDRFDLTSRKDLAKHLSTKRLRSANRKWVVLTDMNDMPMRVLNANSYIQDLYFNRKVDPHYHCYQPVIVSDPTETLGAAMRELKMAGKGEVIENDVILYWNNGAKKILTGTDILSRLMRGIAVDIPLREQS